MRRAIEQFAWRFSYAGKMLFLCFLGSFTAFFLIGLLTYVQYPLKKLYEMKSKGINQHEKLNDILKNCFEIELILINKPKEIEKNLGIIDKHLAIIKESLLDFESHIQENNQNSDVKAGQLHFLIQQIWQQYKTIEEIKKGSKKFSIEVISAFTQLVLDLIRQNFYDSHLDLGVAMQIYLLSDIGIRRIPESQDLIVSLIARQTESNNPLISSEKPPSPLEKKVDLKEQLAMIEEEIVPAFSEKNSWLNPETAQEIKSLFAKYKERVFLYLESFKDSKLPISAITESAKDALASGWQFEETLLHSILQDLHDALLMLKLRRYITISLVVIALLGFLILYSTRLFRRPLQELAGAAQSLSDGDLTVRVPVTSKDEVGVIEQAFNQMASLWEDNIIKTNHIIVRLVKIGTTILETAKHLDANFADQEKANQNMSRHSKELTLIIQQFADVLKTVDKSIGETSSLAGLGRSSLLEMEHAMQQMVEASKQMVATLELIRLQVEKINEVIVAIVAIADESNLLALNTAIRASKTGLKGVGFTVVADKIRELADQTAITTLDIEKAVQEIVSVVSKSFTEIDKFSSQVLSQVEDEKGINEQLKKRITQTQEQVQTFDKINNDIEQQFDEYLQIDKMILNLNQFTEKTILSVRRLYRDAEFLYKSTQDLREMIEGFHFNMDKPVS